jgi:hypothetical protein
MLYYHKPKDCQENGRFRELSSKEVKQTRRWFRESWESERFFHRNFTELDFFVLTNNFKPVLEIGKPLFPLFLHGFIVHAVQNSFGKCSVIPLFDDVIAVRFIGICSSKECCFENIGCKSILGRTFNDLPGAERNDSDKKHKPR